MADTPSDVVDAPPPDIIEDEETELQITEKPKRVSFFSLFRYTSRGERIGMIIACICAAIHGSALPIFTILFGNVVTAFSTSSQEELLSDLQGITKWFFVIGAGAAILATIQIRYMIVGAQGAGARMRKLYFRSLMKLDDSWYDAESMKNRSSQAGAYITRLSDVSLIQNGIGDKVAILIQCVAPVHVAKIM